MHEISVLKKIVDTCERVAADNGVSNIKGITLTVGELTGYIPYFFTEYFPLVTKDKPLFEGAQLQIREIKGEALCKECGSLYNVMRCEGQCPRCGSRSKTIIGGEEFRLEQILVSEGD